MSRMECHSHTMYSNIRLLDATNKPNELIDKAIELGLLGIAITDHECLSCHVEVNMYSQKLKEKFPDFKVALGNEIYLTDNRESNQKYYHFILVAKDKEGHKQLRKLSSVAWMNSYYDRGMERVPTLKSELSEVVKANPGHLIATTACIGGELGSNILNLEVARKVGDKQTESVCKQNIIDFVLFCKDLFGDDFYFEVAPAANKEQIIVNKKIAELSVVFGVKMIIGSDAHYLTKEDRYVHEAFLNSKGGEREVAQFYEYAYLQTEEEIKENLAPSIVDLYEQMCKNSMEIYDKIEDYSLLHSQQIPKVAVKDYPIPISSQGDYFENNYPILSDMYKSNDIYERYWVNECVNKLKELDKDNKEYLDRLEEEADIKKTIGKALDTNMFSYPITLQHYVDLFWKCGSMVGAGRGSSCSGLNHYLLGVTQLDPIEWNLPFWRYLNKERYELGDIDLDLCPSKRPMILNEIKKERGKNFLPEIDDLTRQNCGCTLIATFGTETTKSAIQTSCRGYRSDEFPEGIDVDTAQYLSSLVPQERGFLWDLHTVVYGDASKGRKPVTAFINEVNKYPGLLNIMFGIEGLISRRGSHASGVIMFDEDPYEFGCFMKTPSGDIITQYDLHMAEAAGMTKYDFLVTQVQDKLVQAIKFLQEDGQIESDLSLREVYDKYFHPSVLPIEDKAIWKNIQDVKILDLFQFDSTVGSQSAKKIKPTNILELADANGLMRLMTSEDGGEQPIDKYVRFKNNIELWYDEMRRYGLTDEEMETLKPHFLKSHGVPPSQEQLMTMLMDPKICHFSLKDANAARKIVGKKQMDKIPGLHKQVLEQAVRPELGKYIWECGIGPQMGYSFSVIHALAYSFIGYQTAYIATKWSSIYWDAACLVVNSGSLGGEEESESDVDVDEDKKKEKGTDYAKIARAIGAIKTKCIDVSLVNINTSDYSFKPDVKNNRILYGLKALSNISDDTVAKIKAGRPYSNIKDFMRRCPLTTQPMISLIKGGAFDEVDEDLDHDRRKIMAFYLMNSCDAKKRITLQNFKMLIEKNLVPDYLTDQIRLFNLNAYLKKNKNKEYYNLDDSVLTCFNNHYNSCNEMVKIIDGKSLILQTDWDKFYKINMEPAREWTKEKQDEVLYLLNKALFMDAWEKYATGNTSHWEMSALCFYHGKHELADVQKTKYGIKDFVDLPAEPEVDYYFKRAGRQIPIYKLTRIIGTVIMKNDSRSSVTILTTTGVVDVKFTRDYYAMFKKQISAIGEDGKKHVIEKSWFTRGSKIMVTGFRRDNQFVGKTYANTEGHQLYKITDVIGDGIKLQHERFSGIEEDNEYDE